MGERFWGEFDQYECFRRGAETGMQSILQSFLLCKNIFLVLTLQIHIFNALFSYYTTIFLIFNNFEITTTVGNS